MEYYSLFLMGYSQGFSRVMPLMGATWGAKEFTGGPPPLLHRKSGIPSLKLRRNEAPEQIVS